MTAPSHDQLNEVARVAGDAALGGFGTTLSIEAKMITLMQITVVSRDENELHSSGETVITRQLYDGSGALTAAQLRQPGGPIPTAR